MIALTTKWASLLRVAMLQTLKQIFDLKVLPRPLLGIISNEQKLLLQYALKKEWLDCNPIQWNGRDYKMKKTVQIERLQKELVTGNSLDELLNTHLHFEWKVFLYIVRYTGSRISKPRILHWGDE